jgi:hypothetical protein
MAAFAAKKGAVNLCLTVPGLATTPSLTVLGTLTIAAAYEKPQGANCFLSADTNMSARFLPKAPATCDEQKYPCSKIAKYAPKWTGLKRTISAYEISTGRAE